MGQVAQEISVLIQPLPQGTHLKQVITPMLTQYLAQTEGIKSHWLHLAIQQIGETPTICRTSHRKAQI
jgi:hypothetical protein